MQKREKKDIVYVALHVDVHLMIGDREAIDDAITSLKENWIVLKKRATGPLVLKSEVLRG